MFIPRILVFTLRGYVTNFSYTHFSYSKCIDRNFNVDVNAVFLHSYFDIQRIHHDHSLNTTAIYKLHFCAIKLSDLVIRMSLREKWWMNDFLDLIYNRWTNYFNRWTNYLYNKFSISSMWLTTFAETCKFQVFIKIQI